jgi:hypothetical protein
MTIYRFVAFSVMLITVIVALFYPNPYGNAPALVDFTGFAQIFTAGAVALNFHYNLPDIIKPVRDKKSLLKVTGASQLTAFSLYVVIGCLCAAYFRHSTHPLVTLNWQSYTGIHGGWGVEAADPTSGSGVRVWWAYLIQMVVMLFPVFDMLSVYSLVAITLGNNVHQTIPGIFKEKYFGKHPKLLKFFCQVGENIFLGKKNFFFSHFYLFFFQSKIILKIIQKN